MEGKIIWRNKQYMLQYFEEGTEKTVPLEVGDEVEVFLNDTWVKTVIDTKLGEPHFAAINYGDYGDGIGCEGRIADDRSRGASAPAPAKEENLSSPNNPSVITMERAKEILAKHTTAEHLFTHASCVSAAMGAMAEHFGKDEDEVLHWKVIGYLHDVDYEKFPDEHCHHVRELLAPEGVSEEDIKAIISHGYGITTDEVEPSTDMMKSLFAVDELTGIVEAYALMRPEGMEGMQVKSLKKKFKDKRFAAKCSRDIINRGCEMLGMEPAKVMQCCIDGMQGMTFGK